MPTVVVSGANRGLGLEFVRQYARNGWSVIATCRDPVSAQDLAALEGDIRIEPLDVTDWDALEAFAVKLNVDSLDLLVCNAGVGGWGEPEPEAWLHALAVNCIAPTMLGRALVERVERASGKIVALTSKMGSITDNSSGGSVAYRSSKAALNAAWRSLAIDWKDRVTVAMLHPGWVRTDMGGRNALITPEESVAGLRRVIESLGPDRSGAFLDYRGEAIPW